MQPRLILVCGGTGAGKTTYSIALAKEIGAVRFSIDPWMKTLFEKDLTRFDFEWISERVQRCTQQIWSVSKQILALQGNVVLDLAFQSKQQRSTAFEQAKQLGITAELHYLDVPSDIRKKRVAKRNQEKDPEVYSFEVTDFMFDFMEPKFEVPDEAELAQGQRIK